MQECSTQGNLQCIKELSSLSSDYCNKELRYEMENAQFWTDEFVMAECTIRHK
jgi:hypothetical protein